MLNRQNKIILPERTSAADSLRELLKYHNVTQAEFAHRTR